MANPQKENGYTAIANEILEHLYCRYLPPNQWQIILCIMRKTYGYGKKSDFVTNSQIIIETKLHKTVVSRALKSLIISNIIFRDGKNIGLQKDWEQWKELAATLSKVSSPANNIHEEKLAATQPELAATLSKVSSPRITQKKETTTKETIQKKDDGGNGQKIPFENYREELRVRFQDLDFNLELERFNLYWYGGTRKVKNANLALLNWMTKARQIKQLEQQNVRQSTGINQGNYRQGVAGNTPNAGKHDLSSWKNI